MFPELKGPFVYAANLSSIIDHLLQLLVIVLIFVVSQLADAGVKITAWPAILQNKSHDNNCYFLHC